MTPIVKRKEDISEIFEIIDSRSSAGTGQSAPATSQETADITV